MTTNDVTQGTYLSSKIARMSLVLLYHMDVTYWQSVCGESMVSVEMILRMPMFMSSAHQNPCARIHIHIRMTTKTGGDWSAWGSQRTQRYRIKSCRRNWKELKDFSKLSFKLANGFFSVASIPYKTVPFLSLFIPVSFFCLMPITHHSPRTPMISCRKSKS